MSLLASVLCLALITSGKCYYIEIDVLDLDLITDAPSTSTTETNEYDIVSPTSEYETFTPSIYNETITDEFTDELTTDPPVITSEVITEEPITSGGSITTCGLQYKAATNSNTRIVGGSTAANGAWPWQVGILANYGYKPEFNENSFCGGTIINSRTILTAAHCFPNYDGRSKYYVRVGDNDREQLEDQEEIIKTSRIILHPRYNSDTNEHDIALMILEKELVLRNLVNAACLPDVNEEISTCVVTGWGDTSEGGSASPTLQEASVPIVDKSTCAEAYRYQDGSTGIYRDMMCAGYAEGGIDSCQGDSGGPLVCKNNAGQYVVRGVVSFGQGCARPGKYGVYADVYRHMTWITRHLR